MKTLAYYAFLLFLGFCYWYSHTETERLALKTAAWESTATLSRKLASAAGRTGIYAETRAKEYR